MKTTIRSARFTNGMVLFLGIILLLSISSAYYLNMLSKKTNAILKENHYSVVYAQDMAENLTNINQELTNFLITNKIPDTSVLNKKFISFERSLELEKNNFTEPGEDKLVYGIENEYAEYRDSVVKFMRFPKPDFEVLSLQKRFDTLYMQLILLSQMNEKAIEQKTGDAQVSARKATRQMTSIGTLCFLIAYGFTFIFSSYFNVRFYVLYNGIRELASSNYSQRLNLGGNDELSEISLVFNEMAEKINENEQKMSVTLLNNNEKSSDHEVLEELKILLMRIKSMEDEATALISKIENKKEKWT
jgi:two-component system, NtrC family, sensor histidine kinase KinB